MEELKPCPFCGSTDIKFAAFDAEDDGSVLCMMCKKCEACGPVVDPTENDEEYDNAIIAWNKRDDKIIATELKLWLEQQIKKMIEEIGICDDIEDRTYYTAKLRAFVEVVEQLGRE